MQTSSKDLTKKQQQQIIERFITLITDLRSPQEARAFFESFLTDTEQLVFAKRLAIMWLLEQGKSYDEIRQELHVSSATISSIAGQMNKLGSKMSVEKLRVDEWADKVAKKISRFLPF
jgi:uncharacterized protein YerC